MKKLQQSTLIGVCVSLLVAGIVVVSPLKAEPANFASAKEAAEAAIKHQQAGEFAAAREDMQAALALSQTVAEKAKALSLIGDTYRSEKNYAQARVEFNKVLELEGVDAASRTLAYMGLWDSYMQEKKFPEARVPLAAIVAMPDATLSNKLFAQMSVGATYMIQENYTQARAEFTEVANNEQYDLSSRTSARLMIGEAYFAEKNYVKAREIFNELLPTGKTVFPRGGRLDVTLRDGILGGAINPAMPSEDIHARIVDSYVEEKDYEQARTVLRKRLDEGLPPSLEFIVRTRISALYLQEKNYEQARVALQPMLQNPHTPPALADVIRQQIERISTMEGKNKETQ